MFDFVEQVNNQFLLAIKKIGLSHFIQKVQTHTNQISYNDDHVCLEIPHKFSNCAI